MSVAKSQPGGRIGSSLVRIPIIVNFVLFVLLISPLGRDRDLYKAMRDSGLAASIARAAQAWVIGATLFATAAFFLRKIRKSNPVAGQATTSTTLDGILLVSWWLVIILACVYAFVLGTGG